MIKSMTGYGVATLETDTVSVTAEVKSLNSKNLEIFVRMPRAFSEKEIEIRNMVGNVLERGKINVSIDVTQKGAVTPRVAVNLPIVQAYFADLNNATQHLFSEKNNYDIELFRMAMQMPEASTQLHEGDLVTRNANDWATIQAALQQASQACDQFRADEGATLRGKLTEYLKHIGDLLSEVETFDPQRIAATRQRLHDRIQELAATVTIDNNRFEQELIYYIEKLDIAEEKVRLRSHLAYALEALNIEGSGKKLGFIAQEIGREINTIGSKVNDAQIQRLVVQMKEELEKIKEQSLNIV